MSFRHSGNANRTPAVYSDLSYGILSDNYDSIKSLQNAFSSLDLSSQLAAFGQASDTRMTAGLHQADLLQDSPLRLGRVVLAMPYIHCYKVQLTGREGACVATAAARNSHSPLGVKACDVIPPNSAVIVWKPNNSELAYILAVLPTDTRDPAFNLSDSIQQGGNSGPKKVEAYRNIPRAAENGHDWVSQANGRPIDGTIGEYVRMSETGIGLLIDSFQAYLRVNEACGLWLNYFDSYTKLVGLSLHIQSYCEHVFQQNDEGELFSMRGYATYPWESLGLYQPGTPLTTNNSQDAVQLDKQFPFASEDLIDQATCPIYRLKDYTGYLGQGFNRTLVKPAKDSGVRSRLDAEQDKDVGLFNEFLTLDGGYGIRSAKHITFAKYPLIPSPRRKLLVEDAAGDDATENNEYKFSGIFGEGEEHKVREWDDSDVINVPNLVHAAGVLDLVTRHFNWKSTHPFYYHRKDYAYPEEGETDSALNEVKFYRGKFERSYVEVSPKKLNIDNRYQNTNYYNTASFLTMTEDGGIILADGYGSQITMTGGQIRLEAGGDVMLMSGSRVVTLAKESITRAKGSVDISSCDSDVRIKAERNLQVLGGNSGQGGVLIESKSAGISQDYGGRKGEEVLGTGITLLSKGGSVNLLSSTAYIRTGVQEGNAAGSGDLVIDCANGKSQMVAYASRHSFYNSEGLGIWHSPSGQDSVEIDKSNFFSKNYSVISGPVVISRDVCIIDRGSLGVDGGVYAKSQIIALSSMGCYKGTVGDSSKNNIPDSVNSFISSFEEGAEQTKKVGSKIFENFFKNIYWKDSNPGNSLLLETEIGFSFRDDSTRGDAYGYARDSFFMLEPRWQQLDRNKLTDGGGKAWVEKPVQYQSESLYPWPGKINWVDRDALLQYDEFLFFDKNKAKSRENSQEDYETPKFKDWISKSCNEYTI
jgi:hypothetical protein